MKGLHADYFNVPHVKSCKCEKCTARPEYISEEDRNARLRHTLHSLISITPGITTNKLWKKVERLYSAYTLKEFESTLKTILGDTVHCTNGRWWVR